MVTLKGIFEGGETGSLVGAGLFFISGDTVAAGVMLILVAICQSGKFMVNDL